MVLRTPSTNISTCILEMFNIYFYIRINIAVDKYWICWRSFELFHLFILYFRWCVVSLLLAGKCCYSRNETQENFTADRFYYYRGGTRILINSKTCFYYKHIHCSLLQILFQWPNISYVIQDDKTPRKKNNDLCFWNDIIVSNKNHLSVL